MVRTMKTERGWLVVCLRGDASAASNAEWAEVRHALSDESARRAICDLTELSGASDRAVETLVGMAADAHHAKGRLVIVGMGEELHARFGAMGVARYVTTAATAEEAELLLDLTS